MNTLICCCILIVPAWAGTVEENWLAVMNEARSLRAAGQYRRAVDRYAEASRLADQFDSAGRAKLLATSALAEAYADNGQSFNAEKTYQQALGLAQSGYGRESREYAIILGSLGGLYIEHGSSGRAEAAIRESLRILLVAGRPGDEAVVRQQIALGQLLTRQGKLDEASRQLEPGVETTSEELRLTALNALGVVRLAQRHAVEAMGLFGAGLRTARAQGSGMLVEIRLLTNLADAAVEAGLLPEAGDAYRAAVALDQQRNVEDEASGTLLKHYADYLRRSGRSAESRSYRTRSETVLRAAARESGAGAQVDWSTMLRDVR